ncbi:phosphate acetyltransferase [Aquamicrobium defluvii]|uniref:Phosphate acetyltransferase n=1 Tax=Aquamicrobium defluvii TaxID=69279 RepID=A0A011TLL5_9HYPH|nr:phosphate acetyltransferase [Aquamicrobium defluvii]EXL04917.1 phosphate acetyltransferase [Aquamicrobium defluvii]EZQ14547.1 phosphate acetyltransferase [Halopseudomonas bauzanensis]
MKPLDDIIAAARSNPCHIVLPEGEDLRIIDGAIRAVGGGVARITLLGNEARIRGVLRARGADPDHFTIANPLVSSMVQPFAASYCEMRKHKGVDEAAAIRAVSDPLGFAAMMVRQGHADGTIGGAIATTADTLRAALQIIGKAPDSRIVSSFFLMMLCETHHAKKGAFVFADCGLVVEPDAVELADIAVASARSFQTLTGSVPKVAMLSFSTGGSAVHDRVSKVVLATALARAANPSVLIEGELQFDAAFDEAVSAAKTPGSAIKGAANVLVFPNLEAANIGYKIAQRIGGAKAIGPILQGLAKPANDLSRGCSADDVYYMIAVTAVQARANRVRSL